MSGMIGLGVILFAMALLVASQGKDQIAGLTPDEFASVASLGALAFVIAGSVIHHFRGRWLEGFRALFIWAAILLGFVGLYGYRAELQDVAARLVGEIAPGRAVIGSGGEVIVNRRVDGTFTVGVKVGDREARFIFDTGASTVVLTAESAAALGFRPAPGEFTIPVSTANGRTMTAPVTLDRLSVGPIVERRVQALVARPGVLRDNLLGMTFLERLTSYEVRGTKLILRGRGAAS